VVSRLEEIERRQPPGDETLLHGRLRVAGEQEPPPLERAEQHDRAVVDDAPVVRRACRDARRVRPEGDDLDPVENEAVAGGQPGPGHATCRGGAGERLEARPAARHPRLGQLAHPVSLEEERDPGQVVLVGVRDDDEVQPPVPGRQAGVEGDEQAIRVRAPVDQHPPARGPLDEDRIPLADIEHDHVGPAIGTGCRGEDHDCDRDSDEERRGTEEAPVEVPRRAAAAGP